jgi:hypothetical protein
LFFSFTLFGFASSFPSPLAFTFNIVFFFCIHSSTQKSIKNCLISTFCKHGRR